MRTSLLFLITILLPIASSATSDSPQRSHYAGQETREIKSLSESDLDELRNGRGWGLAKAAELNGIPGPVHLLEIKKEINLSPEQIEEIEILFEHMRDQAIPLGNKLIELERELNTHFAEGTVNEELLQDLLQQIGQVHSQLRFVHLSAHLQTPELLTDEQIDLYNDLRGYFSDDPCKNIPTGHDPEMWKKHNNCP